MLRVLGMRYINKLENESHAMEHFPLTPQSMYSPYKSVQGNQPFPTVLKSSTKMTPSFSM